MKLTFTMLSVLAAAQLAASHLPPGFAAAISGTRHEVAGCSVEVPGKGWVESKTGSGIVFGKRIDSTESYHAGMTVAAVTALRSKAAFVEYAENKTKAESGNPRYKVLRNELTEGKRDGLWTVSGRVDFDDTGAVNVGKNGFLATRTAHLLAVDPSDPMRLITVWFSWRGVDFNEKRFRVESERFIGSFRRPAQPAAK